MMTEDKKRRMTMVLTERICQSLVLFCILFVPGSTYDPSFDLPLHNVTAKQGTEVSFTCVVNHLGDFKVAWLKADDKVILAMNTNKVTHNPRYHVTHNGHNTWTLIIKNVQLSDTGQFMCQINTNPMTAQLGGLEVVVPADIIDEETSGDVVVLEGQTTTLQCRAIGFPPPKVKWKRQDGQSLPLSREFMSPGERLLEWEGETLPLRGLSKSDNGAFLCIASNNIPPVVSKRVMVYVQFPSLIKVSNQLVAAPAEINVTLQCDVESVPKPFISWTTREGQLIMPTESKFILLIEAVNDFTHRAKLTILHLQAEDFTDYNCSARNTLGEDAGIIKLQRIYPPPTLRTTSFPSTHHPLKHRADIGSSDGSKHHTKSHRIKSIRGSRRGGTHPKYYGHDDLIYDVDSSNPNGDGSHGGITSTMTNSRLSGSGDHNEQFDLKMTTPSTTSNPWNPRFNSGTHRSNGQIILSICLPNILLIPILISNLA